MFLDKALSDPFTSNITLCPLIQFTYIISNDVHPNGLLTKVWYQSFSRGNYPWGIDMCGLAWRHSTWSWKGWHSHIFSYLKFSLRNRMQSSREETIPDIPRCMEEAGQKELEVMMDFPFCNTNKQLYAYLHMCICLPDWCSRFNFCLGFELSTHNKDVHIDVRFLVPQASPLLHHLTELRCFFRMKDNICKNGNMVIGGLFPLYTQQVPLDKGNRNRFLSKSQFFFICLFSDWVLRWIVHKRSVDG
jgi:hypothetical protein